MFRVIDFNSEGDTFRDEEGEPARDVGVRAQKPLLVGQTAPTRPEGNLHSFQILRLRQRRWTHHHEEYDRQDEER